MQQRPEQFQVVLKDDYRYLHQHPEISFQEIQTTDWLCVRLSELGIEILDADLETGLIAIIRGKQPGKTVALRADIDALPVQEETTLSYASVEEGVMHACGHDFHTSALLGAAALLQQNCENLKGSVKLIFQPAEEHSGGAKFVLKTGALADVSEIYGLHVMPMIPSGAIAIRPGANHAAVGWFEIHITGQGGHAALPHTCSDPIIALGQLIGALQTIVSRSVNPFENAVVSVTHVNAGSTWNVIPSDAFLEGTFRVFSNELASVVSDRIASICSGVAHSSGTQISLDWKVTTTATNNAPELVSFAEDTARSLGLPLTGDLLTMTGEDFAEYQRTIPGVFVHFGVGGEKPLHHPAFLADEGQLVCAAEYLAALAFKSLERLSK